MMFYGLYKVGKLYSIVVTDIINLVELSICNRLFQNTGDALDDVVNVSEVPFHFAVVEYLNRTVVYNRVSKKENGHIGATPRAIDGKKPKPRCGNIKEMTIGVRHQFVTLLAGSIQTYWMIYIVVG